MNKELKLLLVSLFLLAVGIVALYVGNNYNCGQVEYQNLDGTHYTWVCEDKPDPNCWRNFHTEDAAIRACEGK